MTKKFILAALSFLSVCQLTFARPDGSPARIMFWFDVEDYTSDRSNDAIRDLADLMTSEGIKGQFAIAGQVCKFLMDNRRYDVIESLRPHFIGTQTLYHSLHPNLTEMTDLEDYDEAYRLALAEESECAGMLKAVLGIDSLAFSCWPGNGASYVADDVMSDMGVVIHGDGGPLRNAPDAVWYQNRYHIPYGFCLESFLPSYGGTIDMAELLDNLARQKLVCVYNHPHMAVRREHWDVLHYKGGNHVKFGEWLPPTPVPQEETAVFYSRIRDFIRCLKADPRFEIVGCDYVWDSLKPRKLISVSDIPAIRASLESEFGPVNEPGSWCVADCFQAVVKFLQGAGEVSPGKVYGFLDQPEGVAKPVTVRANQLRKAASQIDLNRHLPSSIKVGRHRIGPADFLFAALEVLETGASKVQVTPRPQLGDIASIWPALAEFDQHGWIIYDEEFKDSYLSDRLRLQFWTLRYE